MSFLGSEQKTYKPKEFLGLKKFSGLYNRVVWDRVSELINEITYVCSLVKNKKVNLGEAEKKCLKILKNFEDDLKDYKEEGENFYARGSLNVTEASGEIKTLYNSTGLETLVLYKKTYKNSEEIENKIIVEYLGKSIDLLTKYSPESLNCDNILDYFNILEFDFLEIFNFTNYYNFQKKFNEISTKLEFWAEYLGGLDLKIETDGKIFEYHPILSAAHKINFLNYSIILDIAYMFYENGADINAQDENGNTILHHLAHKTDIGKGVIEGSGELLVTKENSRNFLQEAKSKGKYKLTRFLELTKEKMDVNLKNTQGYTSFECAMMASNEYVAEIIHQKTGSTLSFEDAKSGFFSGEICDFHIFERIIANPLVSLLGAFREGDLQ